MNNNQEPSYVFSAFEKISDDESDDHDNNNDEIEGNNSGIGNSIEELSDEEPQDDVIRNFNILKNIKFNTGDSSKRDSGNGDIAHGSKYLIEYLKYHPDKRAGLDSIKDEYTRKKRYEEIFPEMELTKRLRMLDTTQIAIESFANLVMKYSYPPGPLLQLMYDVFITLPVPSFDTRLGIFYVYNHLIQLFTNVSMWSHPISFTDAGLNRFCIPAIVYTNSIQCGNIHRICNCINIWKQRSIYPVDVCEKLENMAASSSVVTERHSNFTIGEELGDLKVLYNILNMPLVDKAYNEAIANCDVEGIITPGEDTKHLDVALESNKDFLFNQASRLSGQELIILHSASLDLAALIEENDYNFTLLQKEIDKLAALLDGK
ncbi:conserved hypothetical protein [Theileria equi strain WA]|uniref:CID domain-containing protein n=1 Tax=Theileria equi strain WA TaxID=1537102 RepID=L1LC58_THEEQ|nr:conserved hypothetical protein [Theileria equi strain WA]EKX72859.1 conserved hypothetical protein [Theileria equi strain WA]|eukprot:XP_004832311.1 conserved hypothetical protein [Theileria equi strain WA]